LSGRGGGEGGENHVRENKPRWIPSKKAKEGGKSVFLGKGRMNGRWRSSACEKEGVDRSEGGKRVNTPAALAKREGCIRRSRPPSAFKEGTCCTSPKEGRKGQDSGQETSRSCSGKRRGGGRQRRERARKREERSLASSLFLGKKKREVELLTAQKRRRTGGKKGSESIASS